MSDFSFNPTPATPLNRGVKNVSSTVEKSPVPATASSKAAVPASTPPAEPPAETPKKPEFTKEELAMVFDQIIFSGAYTEDVVLKGKIRVTFRTRTTEEVNAIQRGIDSSGFTLISSVEMARTTMNLEYALIGYHGKDLGSMTTEDRKKFVASLPGPVTGMLVNALMKFDHKVNEAIKEGEENF